MTNIQSTVFDARSAAHEAGQMDKTMDKKDGAGVQLYSNGDVLYGKWKDPSAARAFDLIFLATRELS